MSGYAYRHSSTYGAGIWHRDRDRQPEVCYGGFKVTQQVKGHLEVNLSGNVL